MQDLRVTNRFVLSCWRRRKPRAVKVSIGRMLYMRIDGFGTPFNGLVLILLFILLPCMAFGLPVTSRCAAEDSSRRLSYDSNGGRCVVGEGGCDFLDQMAAASSGSVMNAVVTVDSLP